MIEELKQRAQCSTHPHYGSGAGDGIVYVGGGKYWPMIVAGIRVLRDTGCKLPVEIWYRGKCEDVFPEDIEGLNVALCDVDSFADVFGDSRVPTGLVCKGGWEAKLYAIYHSSFDRILFLDADAYAVVDPTPLFKLLDGHSFVYWKDLPSQANSVKWKNVYPEGAYKAVPQVQGGQLLIDRIKAQQLISTCNWMCQQSDYFFKQMYGDQDTWRVGLTMGLADSLCLGPAKWVQGIAFECSHDGVAYILHRCKGKLFETKYIPVGNRKYTNPNYALPREADLFSYFGAVVNTRETPAYDTFSDIYRKALWGKKNQSGSGSTLKEGQLYIDTMNRLIRENGWKSIVDVGCGDGLIGSRLQVEHYTGVDCVPSLLAENRKRYFGKNYLALDISEKYDTIPVADCLVCKDVLHHWPTETVKRLLDYLIRSNKWKALVFCQDNKQLSDTQDCHLGGFRGLSFKLAPLNQYPFVYVVPVNNKSLGLIRLGSGDVESRSIEDGCNENPR